MKAEQILDQSLRKVWVRTDRLFVWLLLFEWIAAIVVALVVSPYAWEGSQYSVHTHVWAAILLGGILTSFPIYAVMKNPGGVLSRHSIAVSQMLFSALLIHLSGGRIETHFHIFGSLAFLAFYRDWRVLITASAVAALDHFFRGVFWPQSLYGVILANEWRILEHVLWVVFIDVFLIRSCVWSRSEMTEIASKQAEMERLLSSVQASSVSKDEADQMIARIKATLEDTTINLRDTGKGIGDILETQERLSAQRAAAVSETTASAEQLYRSSEQSASQAAESAQQSNHLFEIAENGSEVANRAKSGMHILTEKFAAIGHEISTLCDKVDRINDIAVAVREIADRTNLLALNAAVEAARAGDEGKGFGVVAAAIRQLADHSKASMDELKVVIDEISKASMSTVIATEEGTRTLDEGVGLVAEVSEGLQSLVQDLQKINRSSSQIQLNAKEQTVALDQIRQSMSSISEGANATASGIGETKQAIDELSGLAEGLCEMLQ